jgi:hypothetical protein
MWYYATESQKLLPTVTHPREAAITHFQSRVTGQDSLSEDRSTNMYAEFTGQKEWEDSRSNPENSMTAELEK